MAVSAWFACVTLLADTIASLPVDVYRKAGSARIPVDPTPRLFADSPYTETTWFEWLWMVMESLAVTGNAFLLVTTRGPDDRPTALMPLHPDVLRIDISRNTRWPETIYRIGEATFDSKDIVHLKRYPVPGAVLGLSPVQKAATSLGLSIAADRYGLNYFRDSANPSSVLETDQALSPEAVLATQKQWIASQGGRRRPAVLAGGFKWKPIALNPDESQFLQTRSHQVLEIARWFRVPPHMIGETTKSTSWGSGIESQSRGFSTYTLNPWLNCIEQKLSSLLPRGQFVKFNIDGLLRGDVKSRWDAYEAGRRSGALSANDIRAMEDQPPIPNGDIYLQPVNYAPLGWVPAGATEDEEPEPEPLAEEPGDQEDDDDGDA